MMATGEVGSPAPDDCEVPLENRALPLATNQDPRLEEVSRAESVEGRSRGQELGVRRDDAQAIGFEVIDGLTGREIHYMDP